MVFDKQVPNEMRNKNKSKGRQWEGDHDNTQSRTDLFLKEMNSVAEI